MSGKYSWLSRFAKAFRIDGRNVKIIYSPEEFYESLKVSCKILQTIIHVVIILCCRGEAWCAVGAEADRVFLPLSRHGKKRNGAGTLNLNNCSREPVGRVCCTVKGGCIPRISLRLWPPGAHVHASSRLSAWIQRRAQLSNYGAESCLRVWRTISTLPLSHAQPARIPEVGGA